MRKRFDWAPRWGVLALLFILLPPAASSAQPHPPPGQSATQEKNALPQAAVTPSDSFTIPDGTPLTLQLVSALSSETAKVGDTVEFTTPYPLRMNGLVVVPPGTALSGTVGQVSHPHRPAKNGQVRMAIEKVVLPNGEIAPLRPSKSASGKPGSMAAKSEPGDPGLWLLAAPIDPLGWIILPVLPFTKGHEAVYPAGTQTTVYFNGPLNLDRAALLKLQPPPYKGPAQVFFTDIAEPEVLYCGQVRVGNLAGERQGDIGYLAGSPIRLELNPGTYSFNTRWEFAKRSSRVRAKPVQLEVHEDHLYWIQRERHGLVVKDTRQLQNEFEIVHDAPRVTNMDYTTLALQDSCPPVARP